LDDNLRISQLQNQRALIDGKSGFRLALAFLEIEKNASLRRATNEDAELYFHWANDPDVRANSYQTADIDWGDHVKWFESTIASSEYALYLYSISEKPAGQIRLRITEKKAVISYSVAHDFRGKGLGTWMLTHISILTRVAHPQVRQLEGWVKKNNVASLKAFQSGGYQVADESSDSILFRLELHS
jgi:RimJ/RimL family protein N-acetyltransferase